MVIPNRYLSLSFVRPCNILSTADCDSLWIGVFTMRGALTRNDQLMSESIQNLIGKLLVIPDTPLGGNSSLFSLRGSFTAYFNRFAKITRLEFYFEQNHDFLFTA